MDLLERNPKGLLFVSLSYEYFELSGLEKAHFLFFCYLLEFFSVDSPSLQKVDCS